MIEILFVSIIVSIIIVVLYSYFHPGYQGPVSDHFNGKCFYNPGVQPRSFIDFLKWRATRKPVPWPKSRPITPCESVKERSDELSITFINHASFLIQWKGINILTDPIWSERASPFKWVGPKRVHPPGISLEKLPPIDLILISHNHYDSLDLWTLKKICKDHHPIILVGLGTQELLQTENIDNVQELDWWQEAKLPFDLEVIFTEAQHFSARGVFDQNRALWGGFVLKHGKDVLYFLGDTGYCQAFKDVKKRFGAPKAAFIPIGAYEPRWFMQKAHMSPKEAVQAHLDLKAKNSIAYHFGTFPLADEGIDDPQISLRLEMEHLKVPDKSFWIMEPGQTRNIP